MGRWRGGHTQRGVCADTPLPFISPGTSVIADAHLAQVSTPATGRTEIWQAGYVQGCFKKKKMERREQREEKVVRRIGMRDRLCLCPSMMFLCQFKKITLLVQHSPTLLPVTIEAYCGRTTDGGAFAGQIACLKTMKG